MTASAQLDDRKLNRKQAAKLFERAVACHQAGRLDEAGDLYRAILESQPRHPDALANLGTLQIQQGAAREGIALIERSLREQPNQPFTHNNRGNALRDLGRI